MKQRNLVSYLEDFYPKKYAMDWDNVGLQIGDLSREIKNVAVSLDLTNLVVDKAIENNCNLIITHHPLIFNPLKNIDTHTPSGAVLEKLIKHDITVYSMHTNLDVSSNGVSDILAEKYLLQNTKIIKQTGSEDLFKFIVYVPNDIYMNFRENFLELKVGNIGLYSHCSFSTSGEGTFKPLAGSNPHIGEMNTLEKVPEYKIESIVKGEYLADLINEVKRIHPYEEVAYDVIKLENKANNIGLGRYGIISPILLKNFNHIIPGILKGNKDENKLIKKVAVCGGNGSSLIRNVIDLKIDLFISAEIGYHNELLAEEYGLSIFDIGHKESEEPILYYLQRMILDKYMDEIEKVIVV
ncbi:MAG: Nif3-like dinuclear metal center hexameric protein [Candidatus Margulisbacteria bacterium GWF2_35_9]|nr:MAG: Nif3-like dinuclear metal center hexameric protein [Candidatus Margulisbacteria bacterium GWF2_35_9]